MDKTLLKNSNLNGLQLNSFALCDKRHSLIRA